jgi:hypothetical protein
LSTRCSSEALSDSLSLSVRISTARSGRGGGPLDGAAVIWANTRDNAAMAVAGTAAVARVVVFKNVLRSWFMLIDQVGADRVVFGSEWPLVTCDPSPAAWVKGSGA